MYRTATIGFPVCLLVFEAGWRFLLNLAVWDFAGPTLCVAGMSMLISLTKINVEEILDGSGNARKVVNHADHTFVYFIFAVIFLFMIGWGAAYYLSQPGNQYYVWVVPSHSLVGIFIYSLSCILVSYKEKN